MTGVLASEWLKLRSVRSTYYIAATVVAGVLIAVVVALQAAAAWEQLIPQSRRGDYGMTIVQALTIPVVQLSVAVLGVLMITSEYATGTVRVSFTAVPRRRLVLAGKVLVVASVATVVSLVSVAAAHAATAAVLDGLPVLPGTTPPQSDQMALVAAWGVSGGLFAVVGFGVGAMLRSTAGAMFVVVAQWYVLPLAMQWLPAPWDDRVASVLLPNLAPQLVGETTINFGLTGVLSPVAAAVVAAGYVLLALGGAALVVTRREP